MLPVLQFVFASFWHWLGTLILLGVLGQSIGAGFVSLQRHRP